VAELPVPSADQTEEIRKSAKAQAPVQTSLVTIATFSFPAEAYVAKSKLDSEGVWSFVADAEVVGMNWLYSNAVGGVKVQVKEEDEHRALQILNRKAEPMELDTGASAEAAEEEKCPECGSSNIRYERFAMRWLFLSWFAVGFPLPFMKRKWRCRSCGLTWKASKSKNPDRTPGR